MITTFLEEKIISGQAVYKTKCIGGSGVGTIQLAKFQYLVIVDLLWCPFNDQDIASNGALLAELQTVHTLRFRSQKREVCYNFRDSFQVVGDPNVEGSFSLYFNPPTTINTYIACTEDVQIDIFKFSDIKNWTATDFTAVPLSPTNEPRSVNGYGLVPALRGFSTTPGAVISSMGNVRDPKSQLGGIPLSDFPRFREDFIDDIRAGTALDLPTTAGHQHSFPLVTIGYVVVNKQSTEKFL